MKNHNNVKLNSLILKALIYVLIFMYKLNRSPNTRPKITSIPFFHVKPCFLKPFSIILYIRRLVLRMERIGVRLMSRLIISSNAIHRPIMYCGFD